MMMQSEGIDMGEAFVRLSTSIGNIEEEFEEQNVTEKDVQT